MGRVRGRGMGMGRLRLRVSRAYCALTMHSSRRVAGRSRGGIGEIQGRSRGDYLDDAQQQARGWPLLVPLQCGEPVGIGLGLGSGVGLGMGLGMGFGLGLGIGLTSSAVSQ